VESDGVIVFRRRDRAAIAGPGDDDLVAGDGDADVYQLTRAQETDLPQTVRLQYTEAAATYRTAAAYGRRRSAAALRETTVSVPFVLEQADAIGMAETLLVAADVAREAETFSLPPSRLALEPADVVTLSLGGRDWTLALAAISDTTARAVEAKRSERAIWRPVPGPDRPYGTTGLPARASHGRAILAIMDLPVLTASDGEVGPVLAAYAKPWAGVTVYRATGDGTPVSDTVLTAAAGMGVTTAPLALGPCAVWDKANTLSIRLYGSAEVASAADLDVFAGANALALETEAGVWEIVQFATATLTGARAWDLTRLLRGQNGTDGAMRAEVAAGARVVLLDDACLRSARSVSEIGVPYGWRWGPTGGAVSSSDFQEVEKTVTGPGLRPFSPVHLRGRRDAATGDVTFTWVRRTRRDGDGWDQVEVPLDEASEAYELDILDGTAVKRTLAVTAPTATWTAAQQTADFGAPPGSVDVVVHQISRTVGRGTGRAATITL
jgi:hypothetical protein